ncbi:type IX secretion system membrane protein PorP/SprF [Tenacibaculum maritimum]|uniref:PorP/SprF family type IX secretion system membrane protein n=1 Tax=Tenacibaculum maritimum TaxID=107401 RepID=UPI002306FF3B|nr:type IX secretion system membrane protein PorP/SprF [Tenacibaculum maritimum]MDB0602394.1 type IX secretion system membrane protein PorP/SprF [Tenacibaculum maritimum]MDB0613444.1 type IX secretion system membrane protein PorP/SprF [Tenacibaculum maritimum]
MKKKIQYLAVLFVSLLSNQLIAQETLPIYTDYLSDNVYLLHPAAAGIGSCGKIRLTAGKQWLGVANAPALQTVSFHRKFDEYSKAAFGAILFNDRNGYHSQKGVQGTYAYHLDMGNENMFNQLSFGLSLSFVQNEVNQIAFVGDPTVSQVVNSDYYFNADFGMAYHNNGFSSYLTIKNLLLSAKDNSQIAPLNLRNYILGAGYFFGDQEKIQFEPSIMFQFKEQTSENIIDFNMKAYKTIDNTQLWLALSYRTHLEGSPLEDTKYLSPILGVNINRFMMSYTYTKQLGDIVLADEGFHQVTLGFNLFCAKRRTTACPNINGSF